MCLPHRVVSVPDIKARYALIAIRLTRFGETECECFMNLAVAVRTDMKRRVNGTISRKSLELACLVILAINYLVKSAYGGPMPRPLILCIDDEELGLRIRKLVLKREGYRVETAIDGPTGLAIFRAEKVDVVVLDYFMPGMNGGDVAAEMRRLRPEVPILLLSAYINLPPEVINAVDCTILKGDRPEVLLTKVREALPRETDISEGGGLV